MSAIQKGANKLFGDNYPVRSATTILTPGDPSNPYRRAIDSPEKREFLSASLVSKTGDPVQLHAQIEREGDDVLLGKTDTLRNQAQISFVPIHTACGRGIPDAWIEAKKIGTREGAAGDDATT